jgi:hypothetical protein
MTKSMEWYQNYNVYQQQYIKKTRTVFQSNIMLFCIFFLYTSYEQANTPVV